MNQNSKHKKPNTNKGITLIALVITIIVMLILVAVTISMAVNGGLFEYAGKAVGDTKNTMEEEKRLANGAIKVDGVWYDSIDDYINKKPSTNQGDAGEENEGEEGPVKITLSIAGTKVTEVPLPSSDFEHVAGTTIETGYIITDEVDENGNSIGNEFVWVPVDKNQKITLKVESEKEIQDLKLYDPYGDEINLGLTAGNIGKTYNNTSINPTVNGMYMAVVSTPNGTNEDGTPKYEITQKTLTVKSLYAMDTWNDWYTSDEYAKIQGNFNTIEEYALYVVKNQYNLDSIEAALDALGHPTLEVALSAMSSSGMKNFQDSVDYSDNVNDNGGFYIARYEAGIPEEKPARTSGDSNAEVSTIITANGVPVSKEGAYPYNYITHAQAKGLAESMYEENESYAVSLITGSGWDRTLGWIQETGSKSVAEIAMDSTSWGNFSNNEFTFTGEYSTNYGVTWDNEETTKPEEDNRWLLTTGATKGAPTEFSANNIFDLAGNVCEWTDQSYSSGEFAFRGGAYYRPGFDLTVNSLSYYGGSAPDDSMGFRAALYLS